MMQTIIIDNGTTTLRKLKKMLLSYNPQIIKVENLHQAKIDPNALLVLSGSSTTPVLRHHVYDQELDLIKNHRGPIIGICLGFELIAHAYGSHLHKFSRRQHGLIHVQKSDIAAASFLPDAWQQVYVNHDFGVRTLATPLVSLAESASTMQILRHKAKPIFGLQFHPEIRRGRNDGRQIFGLIMSQIEREIGQANAPTNNS